jgi:uncharacterized ubiquitin-like protein YukD
MAADVKIKVFTLGGEERDVETPLNINSEEFINELVIAVMLPLSDLEGHQINWRVDNKDTGATLDPDKTLEENGVKEGHRLMLIRATVACAWQIARQSM